MNRADRLSVLLLATAAATSSCNRAASEPPSGSATGPAPSAPAPSAAATPTPSAQPARPTVSVPDGTPPTQLLKEDLVVGTGDVAQGGREVEVQYVGVAWSTKREFDASWNRGEPFRFPLGRGAVIRGWDEGVVGMRVGGRRRLTIPPALGYGAAGAGNAIGPNETLVFVVDLVAVH